MDASVRSQDCELHGTFVSSLLAVLPNGSEKWSSCRGCNEARKVAEEAERRERDAAERQKRIESMLNRASIPKRFRARTFDNYHVESAGQANALQVSRDFAGQFAQHRADGTNIVYSGRPGTGKTHLACAIGQGQALVGRTVLYAAARELILLLREGWRRDGARSEPARSELAMLRELVRLDLLIIDEIGVSFGGDAERTQLFSVIDGRYREQAPTIFLTNLDAAGLGEFLGQRAFDRLRESSIWVPCDWSSYRGRVNDAK